MSLNTAHASGGVLIYSGERILIYYDGVEMSFDMPGGIPHFKGNKKGRIYLTTHRVIFNNKNLKDTLQSFSMPFFCLKELELEQPVFGANYIKGKINAEPNGNWEGVGKFKMWFTHGGAIEFGRCLLEAGRRSSRHSPAQPPPYTAPSGSYYQAPPPAYAPPQDPYYSFVPYAAFPTAPPDNSVYMYEAPPPYPGLNPNTPPYPQANGVSHSAAEAKAVEANAGGNAYYNPTNPHNVYMPQQYPPPSYPPGVPPSYDEATKKEQ
ncbi:hypothetical protein LSH36_10g11090 [Paralvinella palmiformis]|uniref:GRAM domain-containing protein n=1 Tax=Paralvinella palmiformis TaxID=53620 RepID=A0AAD9KD18_9ANNE|nr:hypothetical protein LSH36_10g11090 [Paralvinella palmiformis]